MAERTVKATLELPYTRARALARLCKRISYTECRTNAVSDEEAREMIYATDALRDALEEAGIFVR